MVNVTVPEVAGVPEASEIVPDTVTWDWENASDAHKRTMMNSKRFI